MRRPSIASVVSVGVLTACARADGMDGQSGGGSNLGGLLLLLIVGVVLYLASSGLVALLSRRASKTEASFDLVSRRVWARRKRTHRRRRRQKPDKGADHSAAAIDSVTRPPAP
jgi:hypothetical protein